MTAKEWSPRDAGGFIRIHNKLGLIEIHPWSGGNCVSINGKVAWSAWRESFELMTYTINDKIHAWEYLNKFVKMDDTLSTLREIVSQADQGRVLARDACITQAREILKRHTTIETIHDPNSP